MASPIPHVYPQCALAASPLRNGGYQPTYWIHAGPTYALNKRIWQKWCCADSGRSPHMAQELPFPISWDAHFWNPDIIMWGSPSCPVKKPIGKGTDSFHQLVSHVSELHWKRTLQWKSTLPSRPSGATLAELHEQGQAGSWILSMLWMCEQMKSFVLF